MGFVAALSSKVPFWVRNQTIRCRVDATETFREGSGNLETKASDAKDMMNKQLLYRKVNTTAHCVHHRFGGDFRDERQRRSDPELDGGRRSMGGKVRRGLDYTPLFRFLLAKVGSDWDDVFSEAKSRLDRTDPIFWLVALRPEDEQEYVRTGESSYFSGLRVNAQGKLEIVNPALGPQSLEPKCACCTHTFNGVRFTKKYNPTK